MLNLDIIAIQSICIYVMLGVIRMDGSSGGLGGINEWNI
jgi:hypothetical protein